MLLFCDSFDHYATGDQPAKYNLAGSFPIGSGGRFGTNAARGNIGSSFGTNQMGIAFDTAFQTWIVGLAFRLENWPGASLIPIQIYDSGSPQIDVAYNGSNKLIVRRGASTTLITSVATISTNVYYYVELKVKIDNSVGEIELWIDGVLDSTFSGDTQATANASADRFYSTGSTTGNGGLQWSIDDLYIADDTTTGLGDPGVFDVLGDPRIECLFPDGNGNYSDLVGSDADSTDNYLLVDETAPDSDTTYVESATPGDVDTYTFDDMAVTTGNVHGVQILAYAKKNDAGTRTIALTDRLDSTDEDGDDQGLSTSYLYYRDVRQTKPGGGGWAISDVNDAEFGVKVTA